MESPLLIGIDLGATKIATVLMARDGTVLGKHKTSTPVGEGVHAVLDRMAESVAALTASSSQPIVGIGIGSPGYIDAKQGVVLHAVNLNWHHVEVVALLQQRLSQQVPVWLQTDTIASALGEYYFGVGRGSENLVYLSVGSGLGGGVILNGQLVTGGNGVAGAVGHYMLDPDGDACSCGLRGCPELTLSGFGICRLAEQYLQAGSHVTALTKSEVGSAQNILKAAQNNDPLAQAVFARAGETLGEIMVSASALMNPETFIIGGGLGLAAFDLLVNPATTLLEQRMHPVFLENLKITPSSLTSSAVGAACLALAKSTGEV